MAQPARPRKAFAGLLPTAPALPARLGFGSNEEIVPVCLVRLACRLQMHSSPAAAPVRPVRCCVICCTDHAMHRSAVLSSM
jgi:hypothetical protein